MILYKGKERRTGAQAGLVEPHLFGDEDSSESDTNSDSPKQREERRRRREEMQRRAQAYTVFVACIRQSMAPYGTGAVGYPAMIPAPYNPAGHGTPPGYPITSHVPPAGAYAISYNPPIGIPKTRSRGHGSG